MIDADAEVLDSEFMDVIELPPAAPPIPRMPEVYPVGSVGPSRAGAALYAMTPEQLASGVPGNLTGGGFHINRTTNAKGIGTVTTADGQELFWKGVGGRLANHESFVASLFERAGLRTPAVRPADVPGAPMLPGAEGGGMVAEFVNGITLQEYMVSKGGSWSSKDTDKNESAFAAVEKALPPGEVDRHALFAFLLHLGDRHAQNHMIEGNRLVSIDHEYSLGRVYKGGEGIPPAEMEDRGPDAICWLQEGLLELRSEQDAANGTMVLDGEAVRDIAGVADEIAASVEQADPERGVLVRRHAEALKQFAAGRDYSIFALWKILGGGSGPVPGAVASDSDIAFDPNSTPDHSYNDDSQSSQSYRSG